jgi:phosphoserine aminotransferase
MNVVFRLPDADLEKKFLATASSHGMIWLLQDIELLADSAPRSTMPCQLHQRSLSPTHARIPTHPRLIVALCELELW